MRWIDIGQPDDIRLRKACRRAGQVIALCHSSSCELWWKQIQNKLTRLTNLTVLRLPVTNSQGLAMLAERTMRLQCLMQDGEVWISSDAQRIRVKLKTLKEPQR